MLPPCYRTCIVLNVETAIDSVNLLNKIGKLAQKLTNEAMADADIELPLRDSRVESYILNRPRKI